jgi:hypothetical protein
MLELTPAALGKVPARRLLMMLAERQRAIVKHGVAGNAERHMPPARGHAVTARGDPHDRFVHPSNAIA